MIVFDAHCDTATRILDRGEPLFSNSGQLDLRRLLKFRGSIVCFAAFIAPRYSELSMGYYRYCAIVANLKREIDRNRDIVTLCRTAKDVSRAIAAQKVAAILTVEGGEALGGYLANMGRFVKDGVRAIAFTWNHDNLLATGCKGINSSTYGLTELGKQAVLLCNESNILIDVSHLSDRGFWDVCALSKKPIIASHSNAKGVYNDPHHRNLSDKQFQAIVRLGGVCGINLYPDFLAPNGARITDIIRHIEHFLALGGSSHVGLGCDFDGIEKTPEGIRSVSDLSKLFNELARLGYNDALINKISHRNFMRVFGFADS